MASTKGETVPEARVLDSTMYYEDQGDGNPVVLLHGNPTSSYLWRNVIPELARQARCLAPDLIGMGRSGKPDIGYRFADHSRYLDAWFDALGVDGVTLVGHDWGGALGFDWASRHPGRVRGIAFMETIVRPLSWDDWPAWARGMFQAFRRPGEGEELILDRNFFVEQILPNAVLRTLSSEELDAYRAPFTERAARLPTLVWPREIPLDGEPADVVKRVEAYDTWLESSNGVPKLLLTFDPGAIMTPPTIRWCEDHMAALEVEHIGAGIHFVQEDNGPAIGAAIATWRQQHGLARQQRRPLAPAARSPRE
jgi:haloalkane dehalogenase